MVREGRACGRARAQQDGPGVIPARAVLSVMGGDQLILSIAFWFFSTQLAGSGAAPAASAEAA